jgi:hypothetical protein
MKRQKTIGDVINELAEEYGNTTGGIYILSRALEIAACGDEKSHLLKIDDMLIHECPRYKELDRRDGAALDRFKKSQEIDELRAKAAQLEEELKKERAKA